jgi:hypothetical protein
MISSGSHIARPWSENTPRYSKPRDQSEPAELPQISMMGTPLGEAALPLTLVPPRNSQRLESCGARSLSRTTVARGGGFGQLSAGR